MSAHLNWDVETRRDAVRKLVMNAESATTMEINDPNVGGSDGTRRFREIRAEQAKLGVFFSKEKIRGSNQWRYWRIRG